MFGSNLPIVEIEENAGCTKNDMHEVVLRARRRCAEGKGEDVSRSFFFGRLRPSGDDIWTIFLADKPSKKRRFVAQELKEALQVSIKGFDIDDVEEMPVTCMFDGDPMSPDSKVLLVADYFDEFKIGQALKQSVKPKIAASDIQFSSTNHWF